MFLGPPAVGSGGEVHGNGGEVHGNGGEVHGNGGEAHGNVGVSPGVSPGAQAPTLNPNSHETTATPGLMAGGGSSQQYPMQHYLFAQQLLAEQEAMWFQRYHDEIKELEDSFYLQSRKDRAEWYKRYDEKNEEILEKTAEIAKLRVKSLPLILQQFLTAI